MYIYMYVRVCVSPGWPALAAVHGAMGKLPKPEVTLAVSISPQPACNPVPATLAATLLLAPA